MRYFCIASLFASTNTAIVKFSVDKEIIRLHNAGLRAEAEFFEANSRSAEHIFSQAVLDNLGDDGTRLRSQRYYFRQLSNIRTTMLAQYPALAQFQPTAEREDTNAAAIAKEIF